MSAIAPIAENSLFQSIFTAVFVTRTIFDTWTRRSSATRLSI